MIFVTLIVGMCFHLSALDIQFIEVKIRGEVEAFFATWLF